MANALLLIFIYTYFIYVEMDISFFLVFLILVYSFSAFVEPSSTSILPEMVPDEQLISANSILFSATQISGVIGLFTGGILILEFGGLSGLLYDGFFSLAAGISISFLTIHPERKTNSSIGQSKEISFKEAIGYLKQHMNIMRLILFFMPVNLFASMVSGFYIVYSEHFFSGMPVFYGILVAAEGMGITIGNFIPIRSKTIKTEYFLFGEGFIGLTIVGLAVIHSIIFSPVLLALEGVILGYLTSIYFSYLQLNVDTDILGRITGIDSFLSYIAIPIGFALGGFLSIQFGIEIDFLIAGIGIMFVCLLTYILKIPTLTRLVH